MKTVNEQITLRPYISADENFWREVFFDSIRENFAPFGLDENQLNGLLEMQFQAQNTDYQIRHPRAAGEIIVYENIPVGRVISTTEEGDINILDLAVLSKYRSSGIGSRVIEWFFEQSRANDLPIRCYVEKSNYRARQLYEKLGFTTTADLNSHFQMSWRG